MLLLLTGFPVLNEKEKETLFLKIAPRIIKILWLAKNEKDISKQSEGSGFVVWKPDTREFLVLTSNNVGKCHETTSDFIRLVVINQTEFVPNTKNFL